MRRRFNYIVFFGQAAWVSACIDTNIVSQGRSPQEAVTALRDSIFLTGRFEILRLNGSGWDWTLSERHMRVPAKYRAMWTLGIPFELEGPPNRKEIYRGVLEIEPYRMPA